MAFRFDSRYIGYPSVENVVPVPASPPFGLSISAGFIATAEDPVWGPGEFVFARAGASIRLAGLCVLTTVWDATNKVFTYNMTECPNTANLGRALYVYMGNTAITVGQYGWFMMTGRFPVNGTASVAADTAIGIVAAGQVGANSAGKQLLNARSVTPATNTVVAASVSGISGSNQIFLANTQGFFPGVYVSGTGVGAAAICSFVDPLGRYILVTVVNSAAVTGNVTATYNNATIFYNVVEMNRVMAQGPIT
jgi:hypothetical protein